MAAVIDRLQLPAEHVWLTDDDAALYTGFSTGQFQQAVMCKPGFPRPRVINGRHKDPRSLMIYYNATATEIAQQLD